MTFCEGTLRNLYVFEYDCLVVVNASRCRFFWQCTTHALAVLFFHALS